MLLYLFRSYEYDTAKIKINGNGHPRILTKGLPHC